MKTAVLLFSLIACSTVSHAQDSTAFFSEPGDGGAVMKRYIDVPISNTDLQLTSDWTIEVMLRMPPGFNSSQMHIVECYNTNTSNGGYALRLSNQRVQAYAMESGAQPNLIGNQLIQEDVWTHIAASYNETSGIMSIYIDGTLDNSANLGADQFTSAQTMRIGARGDDADVNHFSLIDEVRIWNIARDSIAIQSDMNACLNGNESGLIAYYTFEDELGSTVTDQTSNGYDGTIQNPLVVGNYQDGAYSCDPTANTEELQNSAVSVFPNPANNHLSIDLESTFSKIEIMTMSGSIVQTETMKSFGIDQLNSGIYFIQIHTTAGIQRIMFTKM